MVLCLGQETKIALSEGRRSLRSTASLLTQQLRALTWWCIEAGAAPGRWKASCVHSHVELDGQ